MKTAGERAEEFAKEYIELCNRHSIALEYDSNLAGDWYDLAKGNLRVTSAYRLADEAFDLDERCIPNELERIEL